MEKNIQQNEQEKPRKYNTWFLRNAFSLFGFPFSVLAIILGLYGEVFDDFFIEKELDFKIKYAITFLKEEHSIAKDNNKVFNCNVASDNLTYNHLFIIDRTASTINPRIENNSGIFKNDALNFIKNDFEIRNDYKPSLKDCIFKNYFQIFIQSAETSKIKITFYDGMGSGLTNYNFGLKNMPEWQSCSKVSKYLIASNIKDSQLFINDDKNTQTTNFEEIFQSIKDLNIPNLIVTIISDFDNEVNVSENDIRSINKGNNLVRLNLIYLPPSSNYKKNASDKFIQVIKRYLNNDIVYSCEINANDLIDENYTNTSFETYHTKLMDCFTKYNIHKEKLEFYFPSFDLLKNNIVRRKICFLSESDSLKWRVFCNENFIGTFGKNNSTINFKTNVWEDISTNDTLELKFIKSNVIDKNLHLDIMNPNNGSTLRYKIKPKRYIPYIISKIALLCLCVIVLLITIVVPTHTYKIYEYANNNIHVISNKRWILFETAFSILIFTLLIFICSLVNIALFWVLGLFIGITQFITIITIWINWRQNNALRKITNEER